MTKKILILIIFFVLIIPMRVVNKDGGTVEYKAVLYRFIVWNKALPFEEYKTGTDFILFPNNFEDLDYYDELRVPKIAIYQSEEQVICNIGSYSWTKKYGDESTSATSLAIAPTAMEYEKVLKIDKTKQVYTTTSPRIVNVELYENIKTEWYDGIEPKYSLFYINGLDLSEVENGNYIMVINANEGENDVWYSCSVIVE